MSRRSARNNVFYLVFQREFMGFENAEQTKEICFAVTEGIDDESKEFIIEETDGVCEHLSEIDGAIDRHAKGWSTGRMSKVDLAILRLAVYEMLYSDKTPLSVAINEAVEFAKKYSSDEAPAFINGILGSVAQEHK